LYAQQTKVRGRVVDSLTGTPLPHVNITSDVGQLGTISNASGEFFLETKKHPTELFFSFIGYQRHRLPLRPGQDQEVLARLAPHPVDLEAAIITPGKNPAHTVKKKGKPT